MFMGQSNGMAELMSRGPSIEKPQVHRRFIQRNTAAIGADVGPSSIVAIEGNANLGIRRIVEIEL